MQFGRRSERLDPDQLALGLEDLDADIGRIEESRPAIVGDTGAAERRAHRTALPDHLERAAIILDADHAERSEEHRVRKEWASRCRSRWVQYHSKKNIHI